MELRGEAVRVPLRFLPPGENPPERVVVVPSKSTQCPDCSRITGNPELVQNRQIMSVSPRNASRAVNLHILGRFCRFCLQLAGSFGKVNALSALGDTLCAEN